jgi:hypothetical protein
MIQIRTSNLTQHQINPIAMLDQGGCQNEHHLFCAASF